MSLAQYTIVKQLAPAIYGKVLLCVDNTTMAKVAVKCMSTQAIAKKRSIKGNHAVHEDATMERKVMHKLSDSGCHPNILQLLKDFQENGQDHLVLEYCSQGELFDLVINCPNGRLSLKQSQEYFFQIASAVSFMHARGVAHCDLSLENVLVNSQGECKLCDFGLATDLHKVKVDAVGKFFYMAPEMYLKSCFAPGPADVWSLGIMLFIMVTGTPLFKKANDDDPTFDYFQENGLRCMLAWWNMDHLFPESVLDLLERMLEVNPTKRMTMQQLMASEFMQPISDPSLFHA
ncbi:CAMK/CAMKL/MARK protein kinase [Aphanomyces invadans]|nr:CAMK/CAMKL/MARK protein kinase [Aphanomyces invadans]ETW04376.1 CAMK/CAMKL/MARK protein kinase [Aphanomyces invadans]|eukprot:XP_008867332.1 CAMK/CAMKL/MARK protein kinase [Aphanomyces invadans]